MRALDALLIERNVTRAAARLHVTQQATSGSLRRLRQHFADDLLVPVGRGLELTPLGVALQPSVRTAILMLEATLATTPSFDPLTSQRHFRIALSDYAAIVFLPALMPLLAVRSPGVVCDFKPAGASAFHDIEQGGLDFGLLPSNWRLYQSSQPVGLRSIPLFDDDFVCVVDHAHAHAGVTMSIDDYAAMSHAIVRFGSGMRSIVEFAWANATLAPHVATTAASFATLLFQVPRTQLVATVQRKLARSFLPSLPLRTIECPIATDTLHENLCWHIRHDADPAHRFIRDLCAEAGRLVQG